MAVLLWVRSKKLFLKIQEGTGDALSVEDVANGFSYYVLWSIFRPTELDIDEELELDCVDSGMMMYKNDVAIGDTVADCYKQAFGNECIDGDVITLID
jgi:hypothetical protein